MQSADQEILLTRAPFYHGFEGCTSHDDEQTPKSQYPNIKSDANVTIRHYYIELSLSMYVTLYTSIVLRPPGYSIGTTTQQVSKAFWKTLLDVLA